MSVATQNKKSKKKAVCMMDYNMNVDGTQVLVSSDGEVQTLQDKRYDWKEKKEKTMLLYELYEKAGFPDYAARTRDCATFLQFNVYKGGERRLRTANFCKLRLCPMCIGRRARRSAWKLSQVLNAVEAEHQAKFIFLTLTMENVADGAKLGDAIGDLTKGWYRLMDQKQLERSVKGWFRAVEITRGDGIRKADMGYHPHIHAILAVEQDYFSRASRQSGKYLNQSDLIERWQKALRVDYRPSVRIQTTRGKAGEGKALAAAGGKAALESAKYAVKDEDYIDPKLPEEQAIEILTDYTHALRRRRLTAFGGWMKEAAKKLDAEDLEDGDLIHVDDDSIREDLIEMIVGFNWHFGAGDFILSAQEINPLDGTMKERRSRRVKRNASSINNGTNVTE